MKFKILCCQILSSKTSIILRDFIFWLGYWKYSENWYKTQCPVALRNCGIVPDLRLTTLSLKLFTTSWMPFICMQILEKSPGRHRFFFSYFFLNIIFFTKNIIELRSWPCIHVKKGLVLFPCDLVNTLTNDTNIHLEITRCYLRYWLFNQLSCLGCRAAALFTDISGKCGYFRIWNSGLAKQPWIQG